MFSIAQLRRKIGKAIRLSTTKSYRQGLRHGVAAAIEHDHVLTSFPARTVVDIGANVGQFSLLSSSKYPDAKIYAFEPQLEAIQKFSRIFSFDSPVKLFRSAIGSASGQIEMHVSRRNDNSSLLPISKTMTEALPGTDEVGKSYVSIAPLSAFLKAEQIEPPALLKIDVQGSELEVLKGCASLFERFDRVYVELSFIELYVGQPLCHEVIRYLDAHGFQLESIHNLHSDHTGRPIQADFLFRNVTRTGAPVENSDLKLKFYPPAAKIFTATVDYFDEQAPEWSVRYSERRNFRTRLKTVLNWIRDYPASIKILDYGCGSGSLLRWIVAEGNEVVGVDVSAAMLAQTDNALQAAATSRTRYTLEQVSESGDGNYLKMEFGGIVSLGVLEYLDDPISLLEKITATLKPEGFLIISFPNKSSILRRVERAIFEFPRLFRALRMFNHLTGPDSYLQFQQHQIRIQEMENVLARYGLKKHRVLFHGSPSLLKAVEGNPLIGMTVIAEFRKSGNATATK